MLDATTSERSWGSGHGQRGSGFKRGQKIMPNPARELVGQFN